MASTDLDQLVEMGFDEEKAQLALKHAGGRQLFFLQPKRVLMLYQSLAQ